MKQEEILYIENQISKAESDMEYYKKKLATIQIKHHIFKKMLE